MQLCCAMSRKAVLCGAVLAVAALSMLLSGTARAAGAGAPPQEPAQEMKPAPEATRLPEAASEIRPRPSAEELENWRQRIIHTQRPKKSCYRASYPDTGWTEVPCTKPPTVPMPPRKGARGNNVGNGTDLSAEAATGNISQAEGWFDAGTTVTAENGVPAGGGTGTPNAFSLQVNTQFMPGVKACNSIAGCTGWEQFVYSNTQCEASWAYPSLMSKSCAYVEYWLIGYGSPCPSSSWISQGGDCFINSAMATPIPPQTWATLASMKIMGQVAGVVPGADDTTTVTVGTAVYSAPGDDYITDLGSFWNTAEFNIFGDCCGSVATFDPGTTLIARTLVDSGTALAPTCQQEGWTGEQNNLTLVDTTTAASTAKWPSLIFTETDAPGAVQVFCAGAQTVGDTHITTFDGLYYDFQASGEFVLLEAPDFTVQTRQASGAPTWPDAAVNKGIAVQEGSSVVEVDVEPERLYIDHKQTTLASGKSVLLPSGVQITSRDGAYIVSDSSGNSVSIAPQSNPSMWWINVSVGLGQSPLSSAKGLLGNPAGNSRQLFAANGKLLNEPISFTDLYELYGDSWRVPEGKSLFTEASRIKAGNPSKPFFARDLTAAQSAHALEVCKAAGITNQELLDSCTLDTAVLNNDKAVKVFTVIRAPIHVMRPIAIKLPTP